MTGAKSDLWLPIRPGTEGIVAQAMLRLIADRSLGRQERIDRAKQLAGNVDLNALAAAADLPMEELIHLATIFGTTERPIAIPGGHLAGQPGGIEAMKAIQALNSITGNPGAPGGMALNAGLAMPDLFQKKTFTSFQDAKKLIDQMNAGDVQVLIVHSANPAYELSGQLGIIDALKKVPFVVTFSPIVDETSVQADLILPDRTYLESWGAEEVAPVFDRPMIGSQQPVVTPRFNALSSADILLTLAKGIPAAASALPFNDEVAYLKAAVTALPAPAYGGTGPDVLWARFLQHGGWWPANPSIPPATAAARPQAVQLAPPVTREMKPNSHSCFICICPIFFQMVAPQTCPGCKPLPRH